MKIYFIHIALFSKLKFRISIAEISRPTTLFCSQLSFKN